MLALDTKRVTRASILYSRFFDREAEMSMIIGYIRINTLEASTEAQKEALTAAGCELIFEDVTSACERSQPQLSEALSHIGHDDTFVVWKLDRLGMPTKDIVGLLVDLNARNAHFCSVFEHIDSRQSRELFRLCASFVDAERALQSEKIRKGMKAREASGGDIGRPRSINIGDVLAIKELIEETGLSIAEAARRLGINESTLWARAKQFGIQIKPKRVYKVRSFQKDPK